MSKKKIYHGVKGERIKCDFEEKTIVEFAARRPKFLFTLVLFGVIIAIIMENLK